MGYAQKLSSILASLSFLIACQTAENVSSTSSHFEDPSSPEKSENTETTVLGINSVFLSPGTGFSSDTPEPPATGNPANKGADQRAIARWTTVPFQTITGDLNVGVIADHFNGIDRVEFSVDGGPWKSVTTPQLNPQTEVVEYFATLKVAEYADGLHEIRAIVIPKNGVPRVLAGALPTALTTGNHSMFVNTNDKGSLASPVAWVANDGNDSTGNGTEAKPYQSLSRAGFALAGGTPGGNAGGGTILLKAGSYHLGNYSYAQRFDALGRWLTIQPAPGVARADVKIVSTGLEGLRTDYVRFFNLTISPNPGTPYIIRNVNNRGLVWIHKCYLTAQNFDDNSTLLWYLGWKNAGQFITDSTAYNVRGTPFSGALVLNSSLELVADDAFKNAYVVVNSTVKNLGPQGTDHHPDVWQAWAPNGILQNFIVQNLTATDTIAAQGLFFHGWTNLFLDGSFRDVFIDNSNNGAGTVFVNLHVHRPVQHLLIRNSTLIGGGLYRTGDDPSTPQTSHNIFSADEMLMENVYVDQEKTEFCVPHPDGDSSYSPGVWDGTLPWLSPLGVTYQKL